MKVAIVGAAGRMGRYLIEAVLDHPALSLSGAVVRSGHALIGMDAGHLVGRPAQAVALTDDLDEVLKASDVVIDFTQPEYSLQLMQLCSEYNVAIVLGTTGFDETQQQRIDEYSKATAICMASNFSRGVHLMHKLLRVACEVLGDEPDIEVIEAHHRHKKDAPSGTALSLGETLADSLQRSLKEVAVYGRKGMTGERPKKEIGFETIRAGDVVGEHTVLFALDGERIEITHKASTRMTFAKGAADAAAGLVDKGPGLHLFQP